MAGTLSQIMRPAPTNCDHRRDTEKPAAALTVRSILLARAASSECPMDAQTASMLLGSLPACIATGDHFAIGRSASIALSAANIAFAFGEFAW